MSEDAGYYVRAYAFARAGTEPLEFAAPVEHGCPTDCGTCNDHEQHTCLPIVEVTDHCNLECPICIVDNQYCHHMEVEAFGRIVDTLVRNEGQCESVALSGGEPTSHPRILELIDVANRRGDRPGGGDHQRPAPGPRSGLRRRPEGTRGVRRAAARRLLGRHPREDPRPRPVRREGGRPGDAGRAADPHPADLRRRPRRERAPDRPGGRAAAGRGSHPVAQLPAGGLHRPGRRAVSPRSDGPADHPRRDPGHRGPDRRPAAHQRLLAAALLAPAVRVAHATCCGCPTAATCRSRASSTSPATARCCGHRPRWGRRPRSTMPCTRSSTTCSPARTRWNGARRS